MKEVIFKARDAKNIHCHSWDSVKSPKAIIQIIHGMKEHGARYDRFARFLNAKGYIVFADDHRSHGKTASSIDLIGKIDGEKNLFMATVNDEVDISFMLKKEYHLPLFVFGHSYGSFITQKYMQLSTLHQAVCLCGSAKMPPWLLLMGAWVSYLGSLLLSPDKPGKLVEKLTFENYDKKIKDDTNWMTHDLNEIEKYNHDPFGNMPFSHGFYYSFFSNLLKLYQKGNLHKVDKNIPLFIVSGEEDGVGGYGKYAKALYKLYESLPMDHLSFKLYKGARHELLNDLNYKEVQQDILDFFDSCIMKGI